MANSSTSFPEQAEITACDQLFVRHRRALRARLIGFTLAVLALSLCFASNLASLVKLSFHDGYNSYVIVAPVLTAYLFWLRRRIVFHHVKSNFVLGICLAAVSVSCILLAQRYATGLSEVDRLSVNTFAFCSFVVATFVACFGAKAAKAAVFPLGMLFFFVPLPAEVAQFLISELQAGSATLVSWLFSILGVPALRQGLIFTVPGVSIEIARECSGINSSVALVLTTLLVAYETLQRNASRAILVLVSLPLSIVKNAIRIVTLTLLATHVDPSFLTGRLHHQGGFVFFLVTLALMLPVWKALKQWEEASLALSTRAQALAATALPSE